MLIVVSVAQTPSWQPILSADQAIDWREAGVGAIPARSRICAELKSTATVQEINLALGGCEAEGVVKLGSGIFLVDGTIQVPAQVTLRGSGAGRTLLRTIGKGVEYGIVMGSGSVDYHPVKIVGQARRGATELTLQQVGKVVVGRFLVVTESNHSAYVSSQGTDGVCAWCDGNWSKIGEYARGQIVRVRSVHGNLVGIEPGLYSDYTESPFVVDFSMPVYRSGVEDLEIEGTNSGYHAAIAMVACAWCWIKGVEVSKTDGDFARILWGFHDEVRDSYFHDAWQHRPGLVDGDLQLAWKTSGSLVENNVFERGHRSIEVDWGAAGNVIAYNLTVGEYDSNATDYVLGGVFFHGAHPQYNLIEGNVLTQIAMDSVWGTSSHMTFFRNQISGTNWICLECADKSRKEFPKTDGHWGFQAARAVDQSFLSTRNNFVGNVVGSAAMLALSRKGVRLRQQKIVEFPAERSYDNAVYGWSFGYGVVSDDGSGCHGSSAVCHAAGVRVTDRLLENVTFSQRDGGEQFQLPASFYLSSKPAWWSDLPFPAIGPDLRTNSGSGEFGYGNPAAECYQRWQSQSKINAEIFSWSGRCAVSGAKDDSKASWDQSHGTERQRDD